ncbi:hypothetical protein [Sphingomonas morindae]|uniref:Uncharacterized protein n=1 Tax=Sphingomonas morindae TaxID=1541170 RepID=A0ABY4X9E1_9SPHN|nr:hypothetical protein [Sphingomonas morindae]USI73559.1 hypothetical protein LHA26_03500 [Sphingomonas morindae]
MRLTFTKGTGKYDDLRIEHESGPAETIACPKQGIIPHDMIHYAVESTLTHRGFLSLVADGSPASFATAGEDTENAIERLVETLQAEMWGGLVPVANLIATYEHACAASGHRIVPVSAHDVEAIRGRIDQLSAEWEKIPVRGSLTLSF